MNFIFEVPYIIRLADVSTVVKLCYVMKCSRLFLSREAICFRSDTVFRYGKYIFHPLCLTF